MFQWNYNPPCGLSDFSPVHCLWAIFHLFVNWILLFWAFFPSNLSITHVSSFSPTLLTWCHWELKTDCSDLYGDSRLCSSCPFSKALQAGQLDIISMDIHHNSLEQLVSSPESLRFPFFAPENNYDDDSEIYAVMESTQTTNWVIHQIAIAVLSPPSTDTLSLLFSTLHSGLRN